KLLILIDLAVALPLTAGSMIRLASGLVHRTPLRNRIILNSQVLHIKAQSHGCIMCLLFTPFIGEMVKVTWCWMCRIIQSTTMETPVDKLLTARGRYSPAKMRSAP